MSEQLPTLPTLGRKGKLMDVTGDPDTQTYLNEIVPIDYIIDWFKQRGSKTGIENRVLVLKSETASGKSTYFLDQLFRRLVRGTGGPGIVCTQPKRLTAVRNVFQILKYGRDVFTLGDTLGFSTGVNKVLPKVKTSLLSVTVGTLAMDLKLNTDEDIMNRYRYILIDETHERDLSTDMTLYMLKNFLLRNSNNPKCPFVVCMSATFEPIQFVNYFNGTIKDNHIWVSGASYPREYMWDWNEGRVINNYAQAAAEVVRRIVTNAPDEDPLRADILIFMPGKEEIMKTSKWLDNLNKEFVAGGLPVFSLLRIDSEAMRTKSIEYNRLDIPVQNHIVTIDGKKYTPGRRVIISTNVAETGLTLENLKYVIDSGFNKETEFNPNYNTNGLFVKPAPVSRITQRMGRAGRNFPGVFYPLYPRYIYDKLPKQQFPQILLSDPSVIMIDIINEQIKSTGKPFKVTSIDMIDPPSSDALNYSLGKLYQLGFITPFTDDDLAVEGPQIVPKYTLTELGKLSSVFTLISPEAIRMILSGYAYECSIFDLITIAAYVTMPSLAQGKNLPNWAEIYTVGLGFRSDYNKMQLLICDEFINGIILINAVKNIIGTNVERVYDWCDRVNINYHGLLEFIKLRDDIVEQALRAKFDLFKYEKKSIKTTSQDSFMDIITRIKYCIYDGYRCNRLVPASSGNKYKSIYGNVDVITPMIIKNSKYKFNVLPSCILYSELKLKLNRDDPNRIYNLAAVKISTMSGFVHDDPNYIY
jgi:HrpA-like RNA helicase